MSSERGVIGQGDPVALDRDLRARIGERRELRGPQLRIRGRPRELGVWLAGMTAELGHLVAQIGEDPFERREIDVAFVLEITAVRVDGADAAGAQPVALWIVVGTYRCAGLDRERGDRPLERGLVVHPVMCVEMRRRATDELARAGELRAELDERLVPVGAIRPE